MPRGRHRRPPGSPLERRVGLSVRGGSPIDFLMVELLEPFLRLASAAAVGGLIGINRDLSGKPTGVRLHALVSIGSALFVMLAGRYGSGTFDSSAESRIIQGVVGGIGFLGGGVILRSPGGERIRHINTAATIWVTAALGSACGLGAWRLAVVSAVLVLIVLTGGLWLDRRLHRKAADEDD
jgi:putative Mg2+ transporter-C (MgtC) family protein